jgi:hypothetical protein
VSLEAGYDFLGFNVRRYRNGKLLIKPSKAAVRATQTRRGGGEVYQARQLDVQLGGSFVLLHHLEACAGSWERPSIPGLTSDYEALPTIIRFLPPSHLGFRLGGSAVGHSDRVAVAAGAGGRHGRGQPDRAPSRRRRALLRQETRRG